jgi:phosphoglycerate dehydrogenase-like enzyme
MKTVFLGNFGARPGVWEAILAKTTQTLDTSVLFDLNDAQRLIPALAEAEIVVSHIWKKDFPPAPRVKLLQSVAAGIDLIDVPSVPSGVSICNVAGHEQAIAEYVLMTMLAWQHRLLDITAAFRAGVWSTGGGAGGGPTHGEIMNKTIGIVGYGKIGREVAKRAVGFGCRVIGANRSPIADKGAAAEIYPLAELDSMLSLCDVIVIAAGLGPETTRLIDARRFGLMKPTAFLINIGRAGIIDEKALYTALKDNKIGGAAIDVWWQYPNPADPTRRGSRHPFHALPNVIVTPHNSGWTAGMVRRRWDEIAGNIARFTRGDDLINIVTRT